MSTKQEIIERLQIERNQWRDYAEDLKARHDIALRGLTDLSQGFGIQTSGGWDQSMKKLAADTLYGIAKMRLRVKS